MSVWTENITAEFHQKTGSCCLKIWKIRQGITFFAAPCIYESQPREENEKCISSNQSINQSKRRFTCMQRLLNKISQRRLLRVGTLKMPSLMAIFKTQPCILMSLFFSSDGRSFHTDGADDRKLRCACHRTRTQASTAWTTQCPRKNCTPVYVALTLSYNVGF